jgi:predicted ATP-grasp superfamily ATP-dependent carboligase
MTPAAELERPRAAPAPARPRWAGRGPAPAIILGGGANALSVARSLGRRGVSVYALNDPDAYVRYSRYCKWISLPAATPPEVAWPEFLLGPASDRLRGAVVLACSDAGIEVIAAHRGRLLEKYLLDDSDPAAQRCVLNKLDTYQVARAAGVPTPKFWLAGSRAQVVAWKDELTYPLIVKPLYSHQYEKKFGAKFTIVNDFDGLLKAYDVVRGAGVDVMLVEMIPGPDDRLCSYYTYMDAAGEPLFDFTKRIIRRYPLVQGLACYHATTRDPEVRDLGLAFFRAAGLRGVANVEFKRDERDGRLKLIECNARFTAANCLLESSGIDLALFVYNRLVGAPLPPTDRYRVGMRLWYPYEDFLSFRALRREGRLTWREWLASVARPQTLPYFRWTDPLPSLVHEGLRLGAAAAGRLRRLFGRR